MVQINFAQKTVNVKIVYYGPGMSGKTTNLEVVHQRAPESNRGELTSISTDGDRTLFFDYMPLDLGTVAGMRTCFQVYTVPGQVYYNSTRKLVLQGVDGVIFVADSGSSMLDQNIESLRNLEENLNEYGKSLATLPHVLQWNKRDLPDAMAVPDLEKHLNHHKAPTFEGIANTGQGVFPTLKGLAALVLRTIMQETADGKQRFAGGGAAKVPPKASVGSTPAPKPAAAPAPAGGARQATQGKPAMPSVPLHDPAPPAPSVYPEPQPVAAQGNQPAPGFQTPATYAGGFQPPQAHSGSTQVAQPAHATTKASAGSLMSSRTATPARPQQRGKAAPARRGRTGTAQAAVPPPKKKGRAFFTGAFVVLAAGAGAALAWVVLSVL